MISQIISSAFCRICGIYGNSAEITSLIQEENLSRAHPYSSKEILFGQIWFSTIQNNPSEILAIVPLIIYQQIMGSILNGSKSTDLLLNIQGKAWRISQTSS